MCCGERHVGALCVGALCNDNSVMCCLCFNKYPLSAMSETPEGQKTDVCPDCAAKEALQLQVRDLEAKVQCCVDYMEARGLLEDAHFTFPDGDIWRAKDRGT